MDQLRRPVFEFAGYRLDVTAQVLLAPDGRRIPLPSRAFETLRCLVEQAGELVETTVLMRTVWPRSVVEVNNLSHCIVAIRKALGEEAGERRFILTVPGRGYKFVAPVRVLSWREASAIEARSSAPMSEIHARSDPSRAPSHHEASVAVRWRRRALAAASIAVALLVAGIALHRSRTAPVTSPAEYEPLTDVSDTVTAPALSPDGRWLAYIRGGGWFLSSGQIWVKALPDGEALQVTREDGPIFAPGFTPDGTQLVYSLVRTERPGRPWNTRIVPITGGVPRLLLPNASGLSYIGPHEVMYSEFKTGMHLGIATSLDDRSGHRDVYLPKHERGMAHLSFLSPDRQSVLVVEMGGDGRWQRCRLVPFSGESTGRPIGPEGACTSAAWSPNGLWMYFAVVGAGGHSHLWRQHFPTGEPEQITFGPTEEEGIAVAPDGGSLLTAVGQERSTIWIQDGGGDRPLITEGFAYAPWYSSDEKRVYYLTARNSQEGAELARVDIATGQRELLLPGLAITRYDVSRDEQRVAFTVVHQDVPEIWLAPLDRHAPPVQLIRGGDEVAFDASGRVYYRSLGEHDNRLHRLSADGGGDVVLLDTPVIEFLAVSPDGHWVAVQLPMAGGIMGTFLVPVEGGPPELLAEGYWPLHWSRDGRLLYLEIGATGISGRLGRTLALPLLVDGLPAESIRPLAADATVIPHAEESLSMGTDAASYVYVKGERWQNIYRIPLHQN